MIALTGPVGAGVSIAAKILEGEGLRRIKVSDAIRAEWKSRNKHEGAEPTEQSHPGLRADLQRIGDEKRKEKADHWMEKAFENDAGGDVVIDAVRNLEEVRWLIDHFSRLFIVAVLAPQEVRWKRLERLYRQEQDRFLADDKRDADEQVPWGQQVSACVEVADYVLVNDRDDTLPAQAVGLLKETLLPDLKLMQAADIGPSSGDIGRPPTPDEVHMATAFAQSNQSQCLKRHVGAVIVEKDGFVIASGFNENPRPMKPCKITYSGNCFKDMDMEEKLRQKGRFFCPACGGLIEELDDPWECPSCKASMKALLYPDRNMQVCTAIHAEERAIAALGDRRLSPDSALFTTTFPCFQCARRVVDAGIGKVVYVAAYPVVEAINFLATNRVELTPFRGFTARSFHRVFRGVK